MRRSHAPPVAPADDGSLTNNMAEDEYLYLSVAIALRFISIRSFTAFHCCLRPTKGRYRFPTLADVCYGSLRARRVDAVGYAANRRKTPTNEKRVCYALSLRKSAS
ncbi:unnamed protein product [Leptosia nina]|uniref:Uncharacterized protein n=1 Tax=Leptosia nina TaxID=320188 RepID=A0AAV1J5L2_9NEOP